MPELSPNPTAVGVDGCRGGWIAAIKKPDEGIVLHFARDFDGILRSLPEDSLILVDMIIGLPDAHRPSRQCDAEARERLAPHRSRVFAAPPREALLAGDYATASTLARAATGKGLSQQAFHLLPKIRQLDRLADPRIRESHPELVFARLHGGRPIASSKKEPEGVAARLHALEPVLPGAHGIYISACNHLPRKHVHPDDTLDALALCAVAQDPESLTALPAAPVPFDSTGKAMQIWF
ncbi:MAG: DUF429 domain-containing protein [Verrucomicrobiota bacterium]